LDSSHESPSPSLLILAQVDHACGDIISSVLEQLTAAGAKNVNLVASLTKKGRPGYLLFIDVHADDLAAVERLLALELGVLGWRVMAGEHRGPAVDEQIVCISVALDTGPTSLAVPAKLVSDTLTGRSVPQIEHDFCVRLKAELFAAHGVDIPLRVLKARVQSAVSEAIESARTKPAGTRKEDE